MTVHFIFLAGFSCCATPPPSPPHFVGRGEISHNGDTPQNWLTSAMGGWRTLAASDGVGMVRSVPARRGVIHHITTINDVLPRTQRGEQRFGHGPGWC